MLRETRCHILTAVDLRVPQPQDIALFILVLVSVPRFGTSYSGMYHLSICSYGDTGIMEIHSTTGSIYLAHPQVNRHHLIIRNKHSIFPSSWSHALLLNFYGSTRFGWILVHSCQAFTDPHIVCCSSWPGIPSNTLTLFLHSLSQTRSLSRIPFGCHARCGGVLMISCLPSSSTISPHHDRVNSEIHSKAMIEQIWRLTWRQ